MKLRDGELKEALQLLASLKTQTFYRFYQYPSR